MLPFIYQFDPVIFARELLGFVPDVTQAVLLRTKHRRVILNCHRQWGKSTMAAIRAVHQALSRPGQQIIIVSTDARHSQKLANLCRGLARRLGVAVKGDGTNERSVLFPNGSVIVPLPGKPEAMRGFTANLLIVDEAAGVPDEVYVAATPMLAATDGELWLLSTPKGKRGFVYEVWAGKDSAAYPWLRMEGKPTEHTRIRPEFLANEQRSQTAEQYDAEYGCQFTTPDRYVFPEEWLEQAFRVEIPTFDERTRSDLQFVKHRPAYYVALDLGYARDHAALVVLEYRPIPTGTRDAATWQFLYRRELRLVHVERFRLRTGVRDLVARVSQLCHHRHLEHHTQLLIDATSQPLVVQLFREERMPVSLIPVTITPGEKVVVSGSDRSVPKKLLVSALETVMERGILKIAAGMGQADLLREELRQFERRSVRGGRLKFGAGAGHDDLVMALSMAVWWAWTNRKGSLLGPERKTLD